MTGQRRNSHSLRPSTLAACCCLSVAAILGCQGAETASAPSSASADVPVSPHLILVTVDTLRADHMSLYGYARATTPNLDSLANKAAVFLQAIAQWPKTGTSFASIFIGRYPQSTGLTHRASLEVPARFGTLPKFLHANGYQTLAVVSNPVLSKDLGWDRGFDDYIETWGEEMSDDPLVFRQQMSAERVNRLALELLARHGYGGDGDGDGDGDLPTQNSSRTQAHRPLFLWLHYSDPHAPYYTPTGFENPFLDDQLYLDSPEIAVDVRRAKGRVIPGLDAFRDYIAQYDANILIADQHIGEMVQALRAQGLLANAVTVITADHGESLDEHGLFFEHGPLPYNTTLHVPLMMIPPSPHRFASTGGGEGWSGASRISDPVELVDLAPTLVQLLLPGRNLEAGFPAVEVEHSRNAEAGSQPFDQTFEGSSLVPYLLSPTLHRPQARAFSEAGRAGQRHYRSLQTNRYKLIYRQPGRPRRHQPRDFELYDLLVDPLETNNLLGQHPEVVRSMRRSLLNFADRAVPSLTENRRVKNAKQRRALKNLGYLQ